MLSMDYGSLILATGLLVHIYSSFSVLTPDVTSLACRRYLFCGFQGSGDKHEASVESARITRDGRKLLARLALASARLKNAKKKKKKKEKKRLFCRLLSSWLQWRQ